MAKLNAVTLVLTIVLPDSAETAAARQRLTVALDSMGDRATIDDSNFVDAVEAIERLTMIMRRARASAHSAEDEPTELEGDPP